MGEYGGIPKLLHASGLHCEFDSPCSSSRNIHGSQMERGHGLEAINKPELPDQI